MECVSRHLTQGWRAVDHNEFVAVPDPRKHSAQALFGSRCSFGDSVLDGWLGR